MFLDSGLCAALIGMLNEWAPGLPLTAPVPLEQLPEERFRVPYGDYTFRFLLRPTVK